ncbi:carotenoid oxygenase family protein [Phenylobacterium montanum]|uniref:Dioxygenase n=1 Tax=Phenylobacterium montanum TaxID=2823693 RepID=A0A975G3T0_9CAUL|nr:carotenoid oxygenase family protein [Caulobacter sp. S6]QUD89486.1 carotenoid oxygenase family protein [Caulobacter sp. S6]
MKIERLPPVKFSLQPNNHPYLNGAWTPLREEVTVDELDVIDGAIPADLDGVYLRNTENQVHQPLGRYHPFDGDGMIHLIDFKGGKASYRNRFVRTRGFEAEQEADGALWGGLADPAGLAKRPGYCAHGSLKDSSSTDIVVHAGRALSTFYQCGEGYRLNAETLEQEGIEGWTPIDGISAHPKVDEATGELMFFNYSKFAPYLHYGVVDRHNKLVTYIPIPTPGPRLPHDMAFTEHYSILNDLPVFWDEGLLKRNIHAVRMHDGTPSRFAIVPRHGRTEDVRWFEAAPTYVLHWLNAYEEGDEIILDGYFQENPTPEPKRDAPPGFEHMMAYLDQQAFRPKLHRWRFNLKDGTTREAHLDDRIMEFGMFNQRYAGRKYRYVYSTVTEPGWFLFTGFVKTDLETGESTEFHLPRGQYASETPFAPKPDATSEDDGYLISFIIDEAGGGSYCAILDAKRIEDGPICRIALPHKLCSGTHACWADRKFIREGALGAL